jgi:HSP20 family protein
MATITRWDPFQDAQTLREAMTQLFDESFVNPTTTRRGQAFVPALDLSETADAYTVELAVPGLKPENIDITIENNVLTVKGEVKQVSDEQKRSYHRIERRYGAFTRTIGLPTSVRADAITADLKDGVLRLEIPKAEERKPRKITVAMTATPIEVSKN